MITTYSADDSIIMLTQSTDTSSEGLFYNQTVLCSTLSAVRTSVQQIVSSNLPSNKINVSYETPTLLIVQYFAWNDSIYKIDNYGEKL